MATLDTTTVHVDGLAELEQAVKDCKEEIGKKVMRNAVAAGGRIFRDLMRLKAPRDKGDLAKGITVSTRADLANGRFVAKVRPSRKTRPGSKPSPAYEALWNEFGVQPHEELPKSKKAIAFDPTKTGLTAARVVVRAVRHPGIAPHPFMRPAADEGWPKVIEAFKQAINDGLNKIGRVRPSRP